MEKIIHAHGFRTRIFGGKLQAEDQYGVLRGGRTVFARKWIDVTNWRRSDVMAWLGY